jgi:hypothetical protein
MTRMRTQGLRLRRPEKNTNTTNKYSIIKIFRHTSGLWRSPLLGGIRLRTDLVNLRNPHGLRRGRLTIIGEPVGVGDTQAAGQAALKPRLLLRSLLVGDGAVQNPRLLSHRWGRPRAARDVLIVAAGRERRSVALRPLSLRLALLSLGRGFGRRVERRRGSPLVVLMVGVAGLGLGRRVAPGIWPRAAAEI